MDIGSVESISGRKNHPLLFYRFSSFLTPSIIYKYDFTTEVNTVYRETKLAGFDRSKFKTEQVFYTSRDGTNIPMFVTSRKVSENE